MYTIFKQPLNYPIYPLLFPKYALSLYPSCLRLEMNFKIFRNILESNMIIVLLFMLIVTQNFSNNSILQQIYLTALIYAKNEIYFGSLLISC